MRIAERHRKELEAGSAISPDTIRERGYVSVEDVEDLPDMFADYQHSPGLLIPIRDTTGQIATHQLKADKPRRGEDDKPIKYEAAADGRQCLDVPPRSRPHLGNPKVTLWITEGAKKVDAGLSNGIECIIGVNGVYGWRGTNDHGGKLALPDWEDVALNGRDVILAFDSDCMTKRSVQDGLDRLAGFLIQRKAQVRYLVLPALDGGAKCGLDDYFATGQTRADLDRLLADRLPDLNSEWEAPIPFDDPTGPLFPLDALPPNLKNYAQAVAEDTGAPADLVAWCTLASIGAAHRGQYVVSPKATWREAVHIQSMQVVASGGGKSPAYAQITEPLTIWDSQQAAAAKEELAEWMVKGKTLAASEKLAQREADKVSAGPDARLAVESIQRDIITHEAAKPVARHIIVNDVTPQGLWKFLHRQGGFGAAFAAEGEFLRNVHRYGDAPVWEPVLKGFGGDGHDLRRAGDDDDDGRSIPRPIVAISLAVQPQVLEDMGQLRGFKELGVSARLLTTFPKPVPTRVELSASVPDNLRQWWIGCILAIANRSDATTNDPAVLKLSSAAQIAFAAEYAWYPQAEADGLFLDMEEWGHKYRGQVLRIAGILHVLEEANPLQNGISGENMARAVTIMRHAIEHARIAHGIMLGLGTQSHERYVLGIIDGLLDGEPSSVTTSAQVYDRVRGRYAFRKADRVIAILHTLQEHRFIRIVRRDGPGPKSYTIFRNPRREALPCENAKLAPHSPGGSFSSEHEHVISQFRSTPLRVGNVVDLPNGLEVDGADGREETRRHQAVSAVHNGHIDPLDHLDRLDPLDRADVEEIVTEMRDYPVAQGTYRAGLASLPDADRVLVELALWIAEQEAG